MTFRDSGKRSAFPSFSRALCNCVLAAFVALAVAPVPCSAELVVDTSSDANFFPVTAEIIAATATQGTFGDDASTSLAQSFTVDSAFSLETIFLEYENDTNSAGDKTLTLSIFNVADVQAVDHAEPLLAGDIVFTDTVTFPYVGGTDTIAGIRMNSALDLSPGGYAIHFADTTSPGWEWMRTGGGVGNAYAGGNGYENGSEKGDRDFTLALSSMPLASLPIDTFSVQSGSVLAGTTWENNLAPVGVAPNPNIIHNVVNDHAITADGSQAYNGHEVNLAEGSLTYTASGVQLPRVTVAEGSSVTETTTGEFFLGDVGAASLGELELNGQLTINAESGDVGLDMAMSGTGTATVNVQPGGTLFVTSAGSYAGSMQFSGSGDEVLYEGPTGGGMTLEMNSTGVNRLAVNGESFGQIASEVVFNQPGEIDHRADGSNGNNNRLVAIGRLNANADVTIDLTKTYARSDVPNERRLLAAGGWTGSGNVTATGTSTDPTSGSTTLNQLEIGSSNQDSETATHLITSDYSGTLTLNDYLNMEIRHSIPSADVVANQNARLEFGHRDVENLTSISVGEVTVNSGGTLVVGNEQDDGHVPYGLHLTKQKGHSGDLTLANGTTTVIQLSGTDANKFDKIAAEGTISLDGTLQLLISPTTRSQTVICPVLEDETNACDYVPADGDTFEIISIAPETLAADYSRNGIVDNEDFVIWEETYGSVNDLTADGNGNGRIDAADYTVWRDSLGDSGSLTGMITGDFDSIDIIDPTGLLAGFSVNKVVTATSVTLTIGSQAVAVPEPAGISLIGMAAMMMFVCSRRRRIS